LKNVDIVGKIKRLKSVLNTPEPLLFILLLLCTSRDDAFTIDGSRRHQNGGNDIRKNTARRRDETTYQHRINSRISKTSAIDTFCDKLDLQKTYTPQGKIKG
jgi:hypothetical protein